MCVRSAIPQWRSQRAYSSSNTYTVAQEVIKIWYIIFMTGIWFFRAVSGCLMWPGLVG